MNAQTLYPIGTLFRRLSSATLRTAPEYVETGLYGVLQLPAGLTTEALYPLTYIANGAGCALSILGQPLMQLDADLAYRCSTLADLLTRAHWTLTPGVIQHGRIALRSTNIHCDTPGQAYYLACAVVATHLHDKDREDDFIDLVDGKSESAGPIPTLKTNGLQPDQVLQKPFFLIGDERYALRSTLSAEDLAEVDALHDALNLPAEQRSDQQRDAIQRAEAYPYTALGSTLRNRRTDPQFDRFCRIRRAMRPLKDLMSASDLADVEADAKVAIRQALTVSA